MPATPADSAIYGKLFSDKDIAALFTDSAEVRAMMLVEGALAKVQGALGVIPEVSAAALHRASMELQIDPGGLADGVASNAVPAPGLVAAFRAAMQAPEHAQYLHWGATSQDIVDTALALRLRQALTLFDDRLAALGTALGTLADTHAEQPMVGRTYGQAGVVTTFGAVVAAWGQPILRHRARLDAVKEDVTQVSLSGAAGTSSALGDKAAEVRAELASALGLSDPGASWHSARDQIAALGSWLTGLMGSLAKISEDLILLTQTEVGEVRLGSGGGSSTMPQKSNPVAPSAILAMARTVAGLNTTLQMASAHQHQRDGAAWLSEWLTLPQMIVLTAKATAMTQDLAQNLSPIPDAMARNIAATNGAVFAEALSFALTANLPRPDAQAAVKTLITEAQTQGLPLDQVACAAHPDLSPDTFDPKKQLGAAPAEARKFAQAAFKNN